MNESGISTVPHAIPPPGGTDADLDLVAAELLRLDPSGEKIGRVIRKTFDMLLDGQHTGRFRWEELHKTEKTHCGTLVEINLQREFQFADGESMDFSICGIDVDCKYSQRIASWMIPPEALGHLCLGLWANDQQGRWSAGLFRAADAVLSGHSGNRDGKRTLTAAGRAEAVRWIFQHSPLPENVLLKLPSGDVEQIFAAPSGAARVNELFRRALGLLVSRNAVATVAMQDDYMKRVRGNGGARSALRGEGIVIFGQYPAHGKIARALGLAIPGKGESLSARLVRPGARHAGCPTAEIDGELWTVALTGDPWELAPVLPLPRNHAD